MEKAKEQQKKTVNTELSSVASTIVVGGVLPAVINFQNKLNDKLKTLCDNDIMQTDNYVANYYITDITSDYKQICLLLQLPYPLDTSRVIRYYTYPDKPGMIYYHITPEKKKDAKVEFTREFSNSLIYK